MGIQENVFDPFFAYCGLFFSLLLLFHFLLVWPRNISKKKWKYVDYAWLLVAFLSVVSLSSDRRIESANRAVEDASFRVVDRYNDFANIYLDSPPIYICRKFVRSDFSPANLEEVQREFDEACKWIIGFSSFFKKAIEAEYIEIHLVDFKHPKFKDEAIKDTISSMDKQLGYYNQAVKEKALVESKMEYTDTEKLLSSIWPILFIVSLALRIAKTSGEILHEGQR